MNGLEKSAKTARTTPQVPFETRTRAQTAAEVTDAAAAENATAETVAVNTTDTVIATENLSKHQTGTLNFAISDPILVDLSSPGDLHSTGACAVTDARVMMIDDSSTVTNVSPTHSGLSTEKCTKCLIHSNFAQRTIIYRYIPMF